MYVTKQIIIDADNAEVKFGKRVTLDEAAISSLIENADSITSVDYKGRPCIRIFKRHGECATVQYTVDKLKIQTRCRLMF